MSDEKTNISDALNPDEKIFDNDISHKITPKILKN
jgi:hypothetical protein